MFLKAGTLKCARLGSRAVVVKPRRHKHHQNSTKRLKKREERMKFPAGEKKRAKFRAPPPFRPHPFGPLPLRAPTTRPAHHPPPNPPTTTRTKENGQMRSGQIRSNKIGQIRPNKVGQMRPVNFGQMWYCPNSDWANVAKEGWPNQVWPNAAPTLRDPHPPGPPPSGTPTLRDPRPPGPPPSGAPTLRGPHPPGPPFGAAQIVKPLKH